MNGGFPYFEYELSCLLYTVTTNALIEWPLSGCSSYAHILDQGIPLPLISYIALITFRHITYGIQLQKIVFRLGKCLYTYAEKVLNTKKKFSAFFIIILRKLIFRLQPCGSLSFVGLF